jgi:uroporphyrinogen decarboxylase
MNPRERLLLTFDHKEPDKIPLTARFWLDTRVKLMKYYGVSNYDELLNKLGVEPGRAYIKIGPPQDWKPSRDYQEFCDAIGYDVADQYTTYEEWGIDRKLGSKRENVLLRQFYFTKHPWQEISEVSKLDELELPNLDDIGRFVKSKKIIKEFGSNRVIFADIGHCQWTKAWELRGMTTFMKDLHLDKKMAVAILDKLNEYYCDLIDKLFDLGAEGLRLSEDWGSNKSMFINPKLWREIFKPRYKKMFQRVKKRNGFVMFHSDGNITPIVKDLVEIGVDILNPIQPDCMNQLEVKREFGDKITLDTGISVQKTLPYGTVEEVKREVLIAMKNLAPGGGFIYGTSHYALYDVPLENIINLYYTCKKYGSYPLNITDTRAP